MLIRFTIARPSPTLNAILSSHWSVRHRWRQQAQLAALRARRAAKVPPAEEPRHVTVTRYGAREIDHDNLVGGAKPILDGLTHAKCIVDDSPQWVTVEYRQVPGTKQRERRTVVEITAAKEESA